MEKYKKQIIISSLLILGTMVLGVVLWNRLPDTIATHFGNDNTANGWSSKPFAVFGMPLIMLGLHLFCVFVTFNDPRKKNIGEKMLGLIIWMIPVITVGMMVFLYMNALGMKVDMGMFVYIIVGVVFVFIGNYLPKCKQNYTAGIKIPWTLNSTENWNRTHRMAGWLYILCGIAFVANAFFQWPGMIWVVLVVALLPMIYSFILYKKGI